jgi:hypothetical protein
MQEFIIKCDAGWFAGFDASGVYFQCCPSKAWAFGSEAAAGGVVGILQHMVGGVTVLPVA